LYLSSVNNNTRSLTQTTVYRMKTALDYEAQNSYIIRVVKPKK